MAEQFGFDQAFGKPGQVERDKGMGKGFDKPACVFIKGNKAGPPDGRCRRSFARITSYNVCYTKLLRASVFEKSEKFIRCSDNGKFILVRDIGRITSYNVCYTKLLRVRHIWKVNTVSMTCSSAFP